MEIYLNEQPAIAPAPFGMSVCGRAFDTAFGDLTGSVTGVTRARVVTTRGAKGFAVAAHVPGTSAWSPPVS